MTSMEGGVVSEDQRRVMSWIIFLLNTTDTNSINCPRVRFTHKAVKTFIIMFVL